MRRAVAVAILMTAMLMICVGCARNPRPSMTPAQQVALERQLGRIYDTIPIVLFRPPIIYRQWLRVVEECSGRSRRGWPGLYIAPINPLDREGHTGIYVYATDYIIFALGAEADQTVVMHEFLHRILYPEYTGHPAEYFGSEDGPGRCTEYVTIGAPA